MAQPRTPTRFASPYVQSLDDQRKAIYSQLRDYRQSGIPNMRSNYLFDQLNNATFSPDEEVSFRYRPPPGDEPPLPSRSPLPQATVEAAEEYQYRTPPARVLNFDEFAGSPPASPDKDVIYARQAVLEGVPLEARSQTIRYMPNGSVTTEYKRPASATAAEVPTKRAKHVVFEHPERVEVWTSAMAGPRRPPRYKPSKARKAAPRKAVKTAVTRAIPPVVIKTPLHPMVSRIKYDLERKALGLANKIKKVRDMKGTRKYTNRDGSERMHAIKTPGGGVAVIPLRAAQERKLMGQLGSLVYDAQGLGFANYLINNIDIPPAQYGNKSQRIDQYGSRILKLNPQAL